MPFRRSLSGERSVWWLWAGAWRLDGTGAGRASVLQQNAVRERRGTGPVDVADSRAAVSLLGGNL
jgi:hypothetical protein